MITGSLNRIIATSIVMDLMRQADENVPQEGSRGLVTNRREGSVINQTSENTTIEMCIRKSEMPFNIGNFAAAGPYSTVHYLDLSDKLFSFFVDFSEMPLTYDTISTAFTTFFAAQLGNSMSAYRDETCDEFTYGISSVEQVPVMNQKEGPMFGPTYNVVNMWLQVRTNHVKYKWIVLHISLNF